MRDWCVKLKFGASFRPQLIGGTMLVDISARPWHKEFSPEDLAILQLAIPTSIHNAQTRSARAHVAWEDPDGDQHVYGAGMARAVQKELKSLIGGLDSFREVSVEGTSRKLLFVGDILVFPIRIGPKMPRNIRHVRIPYMPDARRDMFKVAGISKYDGPTLFDDLTVDEVEEAAKIGDALARLAGEIGRESLVVVYYSSSSHGVGSIYWAPAKLSGRNYLDFAEPESLTFVAQPSARAAQPAKTSTTAKTFADGQRPRTVAKLRIPTKDSP